MRVEPRVPPEVERMERCEGAGCAVRGRCARWVHLPYARGPWLHPQRPGMHCAHLRPVAGGEFATEGD